jgi:hypothetical protein
MTVAQQQKRFIMQLSERDASPLGQRVVPGKRGVKFFFDQRECLKLVSTRL